MEFKKKKYSGNPAIMKYKVKTHLGFFFQKGDQTNFDFIHKDTDGSNI